MHRCNKSFFGGALSLALYAFVFSPSPALAKLSVVATLPAYASIARVIASERANVEALAKGSEDPHFVRPKPSLAVKLKNADLLISTGLDLELWLPSLLDKAGNQRIRSGQPGFVSVSNGLQLLDKPSVLSRSEGGVHIYGCPHIYSGPINTKVIARNIMLGLTKIDPAGTKTYRKNYHRLVATVNHRLYGKELVGILGAKTLTKLALTGKLIPFLEKNTFRGRPLLDKLGGLMKLALPLRGKRLVAYHKNWNYFARVVGVDIVTYIEPKPGIPPSPGHVARVLSTMKKENIKVLFAANYYDVAKVRAIANKVGATPVIVGAMVGGERAMRHFFDPFEIWVKRLVAAFEK